MNNNVQNVVLTEEKFFKFWIGMFQPFLNLRKKEVQLLAKLLYHRHVISKSVTGDDIIDNILFSAELRKTMRQELGFEVYTFENNLTVLRKKKLVIGRRINKKIVPMIQFPFNNFNFTYSIDIEKEK